LVGTLLGNKTCRLSQNGSGQPNSKVRGPE
jgi:hypothetical protein